MISDTDAIRSEFQKATNCRCLVSLNRYIKYNKGGK